MNFNEYIGRLCSDGFYRGKIKFYGNIVGLEGIWFGVEWNSKERGRNNGAFNDIKYFDCKPHHGSFVRTNRISFGFSIYQVYQNYKSDCVKENIPLSNLELYFDSKMINDCSDIGRIITEKPNINKIILSRNLLTEWNCVKNILSNISTLKILDISNNLFEKTGNFSVPTPHDLEELIANYIYIEWSDFNYILFCLQDLQFISLCFDHLNSLKESKLCLLKRLHKIDLQSNFLCWQEIKCLASLDNLQIMFLDQNMITDIEPCDILEFKSLRCLTVSDNKINSWSSIEALNTFVNLKDIVIHRNPITSFGNESRLETIARINNIANLNNVFINSTERKDSQLFYLNKYKQLYSESFGNLAYFHTCHPNFEFLIQKYSFVVGSQENIRTISQSSINLRLKLKLKNAIIIDVTRKLPLSMTIFQLERFLRKYWSLCQNNIFFYCIYKQTNTSFPLENKEKDLNFYSITNDDTIIIEVPE